MFYIGTAKMKQKFWLKLSAILLVGTLFLSFSLSWFFSVNQSKSFNRQSQIYLTEYFFIVYKPIQAYLSSNNVIGSDLEKALPLEAGQKPKSFNLQNVESVLSVEENRKPSISGLQNIVSLYSKNTKNNTESSIISPEKNKSSEGKSVFLIDLSGMVLVHSESHYRNRRLSLSSSFRYLVQQYPKGWNLIVEQDGGPSVITVAQPITFSSKKYFLIASQPAQEPNFLFLSYFKQILFFSILTFAFLFLVIFLYLKSFTHAAYFLFRLFGSGGSSVRWSAFLSNAVNPLHSVGVSPAFSKNKIEQKKTLSYLAHTNNYYLKNMRSALTSILQSTQEKTQRQEASVMESSFSKIVNKAVCQSHRLYPHLKIHEELMSDIKLPVFEDKLFQSLWELIKNAAQALPSGQEGELTIHTFKKHNKWFCCEVEDKGPGMDKEIMDKADKLYFTTKEYSTGLGLPFVQSVLSHIGGIVKLQSSESGGLKVCLFIPLDYIAHVQSLKTSLKETNIECR